MGIKNFTKFLKDNFFVHTTNIDKLKYKKIAIDAHNLLYKYKCANPDRWKWNLLLFINFLKKNNISCIFIFDGKPLKYKQKTIDQRKNQKTNSEKKYNDICAEYNCFKHDKIVKENMKLILEKNNIENNYNNICDFFNTYITKLDKYNQTITKKDVIEIKFLLKILGIGFDTAISDGEALCSKLNLKDEVFAVYTSDSDCLSYGTKIWISNINWYNNTIDIIFKKEITDRYNLTDQNFLNWTILCGTDFNSNIKNIGVKKSLDIIVADLETLDLYSVLDKQYIKYSDSLLNYYNTKNIFQSFGEFKDEIENIEDIENNEENMNFSPFFEKNLKSNHSYLPIKNLCETYFKKDIDLDMFKNSINIS